MPYASQADIAEIYGEDALVVVADRDRDGVADVAAIERAIASSDAEIDSHIGVRFALPLPSTPLILRQASVDISIYRLAQTADVLTEEIRKRYEDAVAHLRRIADGKATLVFPPVDPDANPDGDDEGLPEGFGDGPQPIVAAGPPRLFSRERMRDL